MNREETVIKNRVRELNCMSKAIINYGRPEEVGAWTISILWIGTKKTANNDKKYNFANKLFDTISSENAKVKNEYVKLIQLEEK